MCIEIIMERPLVFACFWVMLTACTTRQPENIVLVNPEVAKVTVADKAGDLDALAMQYAAAGITVAKEKITAGHIEIAGKEIDLALANLIRPTADQVASARKRADLNNDELYLSAMRKAEALQKESDDAWAAFEREKGKNDLLQKQLTARQVQIDAKAKQDRLDGVATKCTWLGGLLVIVGVLAFALGSYLPLNKLTAPVCLAVGSGLIALPFLLSQLLEWPFLSPVVIGTALVTLAMFGWHWFTAHRNCNG
jgi:hypothetical protein